MDNGNNLVELFKDSDSKTFREVEIEIKGLVATNKMLTDYQKQSKKQNKTLCKIIVLLIVLMFFEGIVGFGLFVWYESQFDVAEGETTTITEEYTTDGDNANINRVNGNQYNDNATHNVSGNN